MDAPNFLVGGNPSYFNDPNQGMTTAAISQLTSSNFGQLGAQQAERASGRAFQQQEDQIKTNPAFGRNAAVTSALTDRAAETYGAENANAVTKGAEVDADARAKGAGLSMQQSQLAMQENELNYQRAQDASFGNSFLGHLTQDVVGAGVGALTGGLGTSLASGITGSLEGATTGNGSVNLPPLPGYQAPDDAMRPIHDASFGKGEITALVGRDGKTYKPQTNDGVIVGTKLGGNQLGGAANKLLPAGAIATANVNGAPANLNGASPKTPFRTGTGFDWPTYKLGHAAFDFAGC